jgi:hypothetical protein
MSKGKFAWRIWAKALGAKDGNDNRESDIIAGIRTIILIGYMVTNFAIVLNAVRHWNDVDYSTLNKMKYCDSLRNIIKSIEE